MTYQIYTQSVRFFAPAGATGFVSKTLPFAAVEVIARGHWSTAESVIHGLTGVTPEMVTACKIARDELIDAGLLAG